MTEDNSWNQQLAIWVGNDRERKQLLGEKISRSTLTDYLSGRITNLNGMNLGTRAFLYKITGIESFGFEGYVDPEEVDADKIKRGEQSLKAIDILLSRFNKTRTDLATDADVNRDAVSYLIGGKTIKEEARDKIFSRLNMYVRESSKSSALETHDTETSTQHQRATLEDLAQRLDEVRRIIGHLGANYTPTEKERKQIVANAIDILAEQMNYYRQAPQKERENLAASLDTSLWGWVTNILGGIQKREGIPETWARNIRPPRTGN